MTKRLIKSRKAISPILATLLLIVIAVAAIVVTYAWIMTYMTNAGQQASVTLFKENVNYYGTPNDPADRNRVNFTVGNSGTANTQILRLYMGNSSGGEIDVTSYTNIGLGKPLNGQSATTIIITFPNTLALNWEYGKTYYFKIVPDKGQYLEIQDQARVS
jgi:flagellin-like protein